MRTNLWLVVSTPLKNISQIGDLPPNRGENQKSLKPPARSGLQVPVADLGWPWWTTPSSNSSTLSPPNDALRHSPLNLCLVAIHEAKLCNPCWTEAWTGGSWINIGEFNSKMTVLKLAPTPWFPVSPSPDPKVSSIAKTHGNMWHATWTLISLIVCV